MAENVQQFSREFREGITNPHRQRLLGDHGDSAPEGWNWGGPSNTVHILLLIFGGTRLLLHEYYDRFKLQFAENGLKETGVLEGKTLPGNKEPFGFRDGIAQPIIKGAGIEGAESNTVAAGEFILGYKNEYGVFPDSPVISEAQGNLNLLPADVSGSGLKDLGRNGSYLVLRQIEQHVDAFNSFIHMKTKNEEGVEDVQAGKRLAAKMMGRWQNGAPLVTHPDSDPGFQSDDNGFLFSEDKDGLKCPYGAHIRRINPRDNIESNGKKKSLQLSKRHRILRRGRVYSITANDNVMDAKANEVGLLFLCINADIGKQFEFLSYTWANYPNIAELYNDPDPLIGVMQFPKPGYQQNFTIQNAGVNETITDLRRFITIRGGAYFFFPSITGIRYLSSI
jgi:Dyp-type peroxidase family